MAENGSVIRSHVRGITGPCRVPTGFGVPGPTSSRLRIRVLLRTYYSAPARCRQAEGGGRTAAPFQDIAPCGYLQAEEPLWWLPLPVTCWPLLPRQVAAS